MQWATRSRWGLLVQSGLWPGLSTNPVRTGPRLGAAPRNRGKSWGSFGSHISRFCYAVGAPADQNPSLTPASKVCGFGVRCKRQNRTRLGPRHRLQPVHVDPLGGRVEHFHPVHTFRVQPCHCTRPHRLIQRCRIFRDFGPVGDRVRLDLYMELHRISPRAPLHRLHRAGGRCCKTLRASRHLSDFRAVPLQAGHRRVDSVKKHPVRSGLGQLNVKDADLRRGRGMV